MISTSVRLDVRSTRGITLFLENGLISNARFFAHVLRTYIVTRQWKSTFKEHSQFWDCADLDTTELSHFEKSSPLTEIKVLFRSVLLDFEIVMLTLLF